MNIEALEQHINADNEAKIFSQAINLMQIELMKRAYMIGPDKDSKNLQWADAYSKKFRNVVLKAELERNPQLLADWNDKSSREAILERFEEGLYGGTTEKLDNAA